MAKRSRMTMQKRQRELNRAEKAASKRAKRLGQVIEAMPEPRPSIEMGQLFGPEQPEENEAPEPTNDGEVEQQEEAKE